MPPTSEVKDIHKIPTGSELSESRAFDTLVQHCREEPFQDRITFLHDDGATVSVNGNELIQRAQWLGNQLCESSEPGDRVLLAFPAGIDFVVAFLASVRAGLIPVPVPYPKQRQPFSRYQSIAGDSNAAFGLTSADTLRRVDSGDTSSVRWFSPPRWSDLKQELEGQSFELSALRRPDPDVLFLQYTSGSTGTPKGVRVTLANLMSNLDVIGRGFGLDQLQPHRRVVCSWLPAYHDMGLVGIILSTLIHGGHAVLMSPTSFMQRPGRWLSAISKYRAAITVAPCFGYRYAAAKVTDEELQDIDLSSLTVAACGAEPIDPTVLRAFADRFEGVGFHHRTFYPCYGLAECTLMVTGADRDKVKNQPSSDPGYDCKEMSRQGLRDSVSRSALNQSDAIELVSSGVPGLSTSVRIINPNDRSECDENQIGEIWVRSQSVADGYWENPEVTEQVFGGQLIDDDQRYLRTGDLGFLCGGELYVTGRLKDLIIIRGQNHYPEDIERTVLGSSDALVDCLGASFSVRDDSGESLIVVQEVPRGFSEQDSTALLNSIRLATASEHDLIAKAIVLIRFASMPRTSSGKVQRGQCRQEFLDGSLKVIQSWQATTKLDPSLFPDLTELIKSKDARHAVQKRIERVLLNWLIRQVGGERNSIDADRPFAECGIDSLMAVEMSGQLEQWLEVRLSPVIAWSHPNAKELSEYLTNQILEDGDEPDDTSEPSIEMLLAEIEAMDDSSVSGELDRHRAGGGEFH